MEEQTRALPSIREVQIELNRVNRKKEYLKTLSSTIYALIIVAAIATLISTLYLPVLRVYGESMEPTLNNGEILVAVRAKQFETGDIIAFYYHNKVLLKRVIANPGDYVDIAEDGTIFINGERLEEPYIEDLDFGMCNIELPYQVPDNRIFVLGDHRSTSVDSRSTEVGSIAEEQIVGKVKWRLWPFNQIGILK